MTPFRSTVVSMMLIFGLGACSGADGGPPDVGDSSDPSKSVSSHPSTVKLPPMVEEVLGPFRGDFDAMVDALAQGRVFVVEIEVQAAA